MDWNSLYLLELIVMRMSGFLLVNPLFGRTTVPGIVKAGVTLAFSVFVWGAGGRRCDGRRVPWRNWWYGFCWSCAWD